MAVRVVVGSGGVGVYITTFQAGQCFLELPTQTFYDEVLLAYDFFHPLHVLLQVTQGLQFQHRLGRYHMDIGVTRGAGCSIESILLAIYLNVCLLEWS